MIQKAATFRMEDYGKKSPFASFLPAIAGIKGIPLWCYYVNRGQGVVSFGVKDKDHGIMEFYPAHQAYQNAKTTGFRTFIKKDGVVLEPFSDERVKHAMEISMNGFAIEEMNSKSGLKMKVEYFTLPEERLGALVRTVTIENCSAAETELEILDGMPSLIPYGVGLDSMKNMGQTAKAWMQAEDVETNIPYYRVRASMEDTADVSEIEGGNFAMGCLEDGTLLHVIADPELVFGYDNSMRRAVAFEECGLDGIFAKKQIVENKLPCCFFGLRRKLGAGEKITVHELIGQASRKEALDSFAGRKLDAAYFEGKKERAEQLVEQLCSAVRTRTASEEFDSYCQYTYMDNVLRGGYPIRLGGNKVFYVYGRKHGDLERDYNYFSILPEFYSQGNGNFRDMNQNRRCDTFFAPFLGKKNIKDFYSLIQLDGYNPLAVQMTTYRLSEEKAGQLLDGQKQKEIISFVTKAFTPGALYAELSGLYEEDEAERLFENIIGAADSLVNADFGEGYWSDHWTYNLDLILDYLEVYPDKEKELLFEEDYTSFCTQININRREKRYVETPKGLRQYRALDGESRRTGETAGDKLVRVDYQQGEVLRLSLMEKLILLCSTKFAALDAYGMGIEMEGGKPGWYDALNGLPGIFGSSMTETYELDRCLTYTIGMLRKYQGQVRLLEEIGDLVEKLYEINVSCQEKITSLDEISDAETVKKDGELIDFWNRINDVKEEYRDKVFSGVSGQKRSFEADCLADMLESFLRTVQSGIKKALVLGGKICPAYFSYRVTEYKKTEQGFLPLKFVVESVPYFLEGPVRYLKLDNTKECKREMYEAVKNSELYDNKLHMYKVNAPLGEASYELGRARAFTPGWLENESVWLHMEYKYLLELLRSGLYKEFFEDFKNAAVPFLDSDIYGRSIYENSSFIASSSNPDESTHGKGFVARLSGSTIEFISMWKLMLFGKSIFSVKNGELVFSPQPALPEYLIPEDGAVSTVMLGNVTVEYRFDKRRDYIPPQYRIERFTLMYQDGSVKEVEDSVVAGQTAMDVRDGLVRRIEICISKQN